jgi:hypothetical protein
MRLPPLRIAIGRSIRLAMSCGVFEMIDMLVIAMTADLLDIRVKDHKGKMKSSFMGHRHQWDNPGS